MLKHIIKRNMYRFLIGLQQNKALCFACGQDCLNKGGYAIKIQNGIRILLCKECTCHLKPNMEK